MVQSMLSLADIDEISSNPRKCLRDREIKKSEDRVRRTATVLKEDFVKVQMKCFFLFPDLKEQQKSGRLPFTVS